MKRRDLLKATLAGATALAAPRIGRPEPRSTITFVPHADLAALDPVWTTADITRNFALAVFDTLYGYDAKLKGQPQMVEGHTLAMTARNGNCGCATACSSTTGLPSWPAIVSPRSRAGQSAIRWAKP
jgi:hypothetical protein